jgi:hypothetical protein
MFDAPNSHGNAHGKFSPQALIGNPDGVRDSSPGSSAKRDHPGYSIAINKLDPEGLARALSPSASTPPQCQQPKQGYTKLNKPKQRFGPPGGRGNGGPDAVSPLNFSLQAVSTCFKPFQGFFRKKRLFVFPGQASSQNGHGAVTIRVFASLRLCVRLVPKIRGIKPISDRCRPKNLKRQQALMPSGIDPMGLTNPMHRPCQLLLL